MEEEIKAILQVNFVGKSNNHRKGKLAYFKSHTDRKNR